MDLNWEVRKPDVDVTAYRGMGAPIMKAPAGSKVKKMHESTSMSGH